MSNPTQTSVPAPDASAARHNLAELAKVPLTPRQENGLEQLYEHALGSATWRSRKIAELRKLFGLERIADRLCVRAADATADLRVAVLLYCEVPTLPPCAEELVIEHQAELVLHYPEAILRGPLPGYAIVEIAQPRHVFHSNVATAGGSQRLCLGAIVPRGLPLTEALLQTYAALTMQSIAIDPGDPAGVMSRVAAEWWQANASRIPLTTAPFLAPAVRRPTPEVAS